MADAAGGPRGAANRIGCAPAQTLTDHHRARQGLDIFAASFPATRVFQYFAGSTEGRECRAGLKASSQGMRRTAVLLDEAQSDGIPYGYGENTSAEKRSW